MSPKQIILVTGANNGIGYDTSYKLVAQSPNNHVIMGSRNIAKGEKALNELQARNPRGTLSLVVLDINSDESINSAVETIRGDFGRVDVLVNNAGVYEHGVSRAKLRSVFETNVFGPTLLAEAILPLLNASKTRKIINVSSLLGSINQRCDPSFSYYGVTADVYRMSKASLNMLSACQYHTLKDEGFKVWAYCPGYVVTDLSGADDRQNRVDSGAESAETSAHGIWEIIEGKRDAEAGTFIGRYGQSNPW
ncbi:short chain dehydrogenase [Corynespora cassiicola Philippines]|uniref:Short chain dehydrogenase n=1 Tax=Corynespora cassiicola Philippines TaxID=1448308 RepID=A0A2T2P9B6_CORCC|nr:short chain dehydrogenase [Corynespora cassiicola Philippines]